MCECPSRRASVQGQGVLFTETLIHSAKGRGISGNQRALAAIAPEETIGMEHRHAPSPCVSTF